MNGLIVDSCCYTCLGIKYYLETTPIYIQYAKSIEDINTGTIFPDIILINLSEYCKFNGYSKKLLNFFSQFNHTKIFIYLDMPFPNTARPIVLKNSIYILNKQSIVKLLATLAQFSNQPNFSELIARYYGEYPVLTKREITIMQYWMTEIPNYKIARKLNICSRTVYVHKQHIIEKLHVRNRLEFYYLHNIIKNTNH